MSNEIVTQENLNSLLGSDLLSADMINNLLEDIEESANTNTVSYGKEPQFENIRYLSSNKWLNDNGEFQWSLPDNKDFTEELDNIKGTITKLIGYIAHASIGAAASKWGKWDGNSESYKTSCRLVGYKSQNEYITKKPDIQPLKQLYQWDNNYEATDSKGNSYVGGYNPRKPNPLVEKLGMFGSKNGLCSECIKRGDNVLKIDGEVYIDPVNNKPVTCDIKNSYIIFAVTAFETTTIKIDKKNPKNEPEIITTHYDISDLAKDNEDLENEDFILLKINLAKKSGLSGVWNSQEKVREVEGYATLCSSLAKSKNPEIQNNPLRKIPYFNEISIFIAPGQPKNYLHFEANAPNVALLKKVQELVQEVKKTAEYVVIPNSELENTQTVVYDNDLPPLRTVVVEEEDDDDVNPFDED